jgi:hypothetical protein
MSENVRAFNFERIYGSIGHISNLNFHIMNEILSEQFDILRTVILSC